MAEEIIEVKKKGQSHSMTPRKDVDTITVALLAAAAWEKSGLTLKWTTWEELKSDAKHFKQVTDERSTTVSERRVDTADIRVVNKLINRSIKHLKAYINEGCDEGQNPEVYYPQFGIVKQSGKYAIPNDHDRRQHALKMLVSAVERFGMSERRYGKAFWQNLLDRFSAAKSSASEHDSDSAGQISIKKELKPRIIKTLNALIRIIQGNYPDSWREELRVWGFQKEKY